MTNDEKPLIERRRRKALRPVAEKKVCVECKLLRARSRGRRLTLFEVRVTKWEHLGILAAFVLGVAYLVAAWLAKH